MTDFNIQLVYKFEHGAIFVKLKQNSFNFKNILKIVKFYQAEDVSKLAKRCRNFNFFQT